MTAPTFEKCIFTANTAYTYGGAVYAEIYAAPTFRECTFSGNVAGLTGGGIFGFAGCIIELISCTFYGNQAGEGAGLYFWDHCYPKLHNTIVAFNEQSEGFYCDETCEPYLTCSDIYGNAGGDWVGYIADQFGIEGNISVDPLFCDAPLGDFGLDSRSPCLLEHNPECGQIGAWGLGCVFSDVFDPPLQAQIRFRCLPNPLRPGDAVRYAVGTAPSGSAVRLSVYDLTGREIRVLRDQQQSAGEYQAAWDGCDAAGVAVRSGVYFYTLTQGAARESRAVVFVP